MVAASSILAVLAVTGSTMAVAVLPRVDEELPCMQPSLNFQKWTVSDFTYGWVKTANNPTNTYTNSEVKFKVTSDALSYPIECSGKSTTPEFGGDQLFDCKGTIISYVEFRYNSETLVLNLASGWLCDTKQFEHAGSAEITLDCTSEYQETSNWTPESGLPFSTDRMYCASPKAFNVPSDTPGAPPLYQNDKH